MKKHLTSKQASENLPLNILKLATMTCVKQADNAGKGEVTPPTFICRLGARVLTFSEKFE